MPATPTRAATCGPDTLPVFTLATDRVEDWVLVEDYVARNEARVIIEFGVGSTPELARDRSLTFPCISAAVCR